MSCCAAHSGMMIDSRGGGRRNDLETLQLAAPVAGAITSRSPTIRLHHRQPGQTYGLSRLDSLFYGTGVYFNPCPDDRGACAAIFCPSFGICVDVGRMALIGTYRKLVAQWRQVAGARSAIFILTPYSLGADCWMAWQFNRPGGRRRHDPAFRREQNQSDTLRAQFRGLDPAATHTVRNLDDESATESLAWNSWSRAHIAVPVIKQGLRVQFDLLQQEVLSGGDVVGSNDRGLDRVLGARIKNREARRSFSCYFSGLSVVVLRKQGVVLMRNLPRSRSMNAAMNCSRSDPGGILLVVGERSVSCPGDGRGWHHTTAPGHLRWRGKIPETNPVEWAKFQLVQQRP
ncbi:MAG: hypothetical protein IPN11_17060 [Opitutaceae bacterium]|nr:hypothetical protein [Opitutaceae bacterium]